MSAEVLSKAIDKDITSLIELKDKLVSLVQNADSPSDMNHRFMKMASEDPSHFELFQTLMLQQDIQLSSQKNFKEATIRVINEIINFKISSLNSLGDLNRRVNVLESSSKAPTVKLPILGSVLRKDFMTTLAIVFMFLFTAYSINPLAAQKTVETIVDPKKAIKKTFTDLKGD